MSARNELYAFINQLIEDGHTILPGSTTAKKIGELLDRIEDNRSHHDATRILDLHYDACLQHGTDVGAGLVKAAAQIDPYVRRGDQLVDKRTGQPVTI